MHEDNLHEDGKRSRRVARYFPLHVHNTEQAHATTNLQFCAKLCESQFECACREGQGGSSGKVVLTLCPLRTAHCTLYIANCTLHVVEHEAVDLQICPISKAQLQGARGKEAGGQAHSNSVSRPVMHNALNTCTCAIVHEAAYPIRFRNLIKKTSRCTEGQVARYILTVSPAKVCVR